MVYQLQSSRYLIKEIDGQFCSSPSDMTVTNAVSWRNELTVHSESVLRKQHDLSYNNNIHNSSKIFTMIPSIQLPKRPHRHIKNFHL